MSKTILVLDDNPLVHSLVAAALAANEITLSHEFSPSRFIEQAVTVQPEMILLGSLAQDRELKICKKLLETLPNTFLLLLVDSMAARPTMEEVEALQVHGVLQKPFESSELQQHVIRHLNIAGLTQGGSEFAQTQQQESGFNPLESINPIDDDVPSLLKGQVGPPGLEAPAVSQSELATELNLEDAFVPVAGPRLTDGVPQPVATDEPPLANASNAPDTKLFEEKFDALAPESEPSTSSVFPEGEAPVDALLEDNLSQYAQTLAGGTQDVLNELPPPTADTTSVDEETTLWNPESTEVTGVDVTQFGGEMDEEFEVAEVGKLHTDGVLAAQEEAVSIAALDEVTAQDEASSLLEGDNATTGMQTAKGMLQSSAAGELDALSQEEIIKKTAAYDDHFVMASGEFPDFEAEEGIVAEIFEQHELDLNAIQASTGSVNAVEEVSVEVGDPAVDSSVFNQDEAKDEPPSLEASLSSVLQDEDALSVLEASGQVQDGITEVLDTLPDKDDALNPTITASALLTEQEEVTTTTTAAAIDEVDVSQYEGDPMEGLADLHLEAVDLKNEVMDEHFDGVTQGTLAVVDAAEKLDVDTLNLETLSQDNSVDDLIADPLQSQEAPLEMDGQGGVSPNLEKMPALQGEQSLHGLNEQIAEDSLGGSLPPLEEVVETPADAESSFDDDMDFLREAVAGAGENLDDVLKSENVALSTPPSAMLEKVSAVQPSEGNAMPDAENIELGVEDLELPPAETGDSPISRAYGAETIEGDDVPVSEALKPSKPGVPAAAAPGNAVDLLQGDPGISDPGVNQAQVAEALQNAGLTESTIDLIDPSMRAQLGQVLDSVISFSVRKAVREAMPRVLQQVKDN